MGLCLSASRSLDVDHGGLWSRLPWVLWQLSASWLDLAGCMRLAAVCTSFRDQHAGSKLCPVELDLSRVERIHSSATTANFVAGLQLHTWTALRTLDLGTSGSLGRVLYVPPWVRQLRWIGPSVPRGLRMPLELPDVEIQLREPQAAPFVRGTVLLEAVQCRRTFSVTWDIENFFETRGLGTPIQLSSPRFRAFGHDWRGIVFPRNVFHGVGAYLRDETVERSTTRAGLQSLWCDFRITPLGPSPAPREFRQWAFNGKDRSSCG